MAAEGETRIQLCGNLVIRVAGRRLERDLPGRQGLLLFAFLTLNRDRFVDRGELREAVWPADLPSAPEIALSALLSKLRRSLGQDVLQGRVDPRLVLPAAAFVDVEAASDAVHRAESCVARRDWAGAYASGHVALYIARREFLAGFDVPWVDERRRELRDVCVRAHECCAAAQLAIGGSELPIAERQARRLVELEPYRESGYGLLMEILDARGNTAEALRVYEGLRCLLRDELGTAPGPALQAVHSRLLRRGPPA